MDAASPGASLGGPDAARRRSSTTCPGVTVGHAVLSNTFRHPVVLAKAATVLDHATGGRFILGLGAGWFEGEHEPFGIELPPIGRADRPARVGRRTSSRRSSRRGRRAARASPGPIPFYPLDGATNAAAAADARAARRSGSAARSRAASRSPPATATAGCCRAIPTPATSTTSREKRDAILAAMRGDRARPGRVRLRRPRSPTGRRPPTSRREAVEAALAFVEAGATHLVLGMPAAPRARRASTPSPARSPSRSARRSGERSRSAAPDRRSRSGRPCRDRRARPTLPPGPRPALRHGAQRRRPRPRPRRPVHRRRPRPGPGGRRGARSAATSGCC